MKLDLIKGTETSLMIDNVDDAIREEGFLAESYQKARKALNDYISQTDDIRRKLKRERTTSGVNDCLYRSPQNIIAFSGRRGTGKTSAMLSFSQSLAVANSSERSDAYVLNRNVVILDPIDPTMLEQDQNILNVILSRILYKAEEVWMQSMDYNRRYQDKEKEKNEILSVAKKCLSGIAAIKSSGSMETLADLQKIGDSAILKRDFFQLAELLIRFCGSSGNPVSEYGLLVLQIDDTDCQISKGYQVLEDIRKYLTIPNVVILMAADLDMMRLVLTQHFVEEFNSDLKQGFMMKDETRHYADKYMAKLFPPAHKIYLPLIDEVMLDEVNRIKLGYYEAEDTDKQNNLLKMGTGFQTKVLCFIYQKTHLVFAAHDAYINNIIPTTLRGLTYLLNILGSLEDVPQLDCSKITDAAGLIEELERQLPILEWNLNIFEEYFLNDWIQAKLSHNMIDIIKSVSSQVAEERNRYAYNEFLDYYNNKSAEISTSWNATEDRAVSGYYDLDRLLQGILGTLEDLDFQWDREFRQRDDFYNIFSIRTLISIKNNKEIIKIKRQAIKKANNSPGQHLILDYMATKTSLPDALYLDKKAYGEYTIVEDKIYNFTDDILACLSPKHSDFLNKTQQQIFMKQEIAALIACNFEVQEVVRKKVKIMKAKKSYESLQQAVEAAFKEIQERIIKLNDGMLSAYVEDIAPFNYYYCKCEMQRQQIEAEKQEKAAQERISLRKRRFKEMKDLSERVGGYPTSDDTKRINDIKENFIRIANKIEEYLTDFVSRNVWRTEGKYLIAQLKEYEVTLDEQNIPDNEDEYNDLKQKIRGFLEKIEPKH